MSIAKSPAMSRENSRWILFALHFLLSLLSLTSVRAICPSKCSCDDETLVVTCEKSNLDVVPITLNPGVRKLFLKRNAIRVVDSSLAFYKELEYLDLSNNLLESLESHAFQAQTKLQVLKLSRNQVSLLSADTFGGLQTLQTLRVLQLDENELHQVVDGSFTLLTVLEELDLSANRITDISTGAFVGLKSLRILLLKRNNLRKVPTDALGYLTNLALLDISGNPFGNVEDGAFHSLSSLADLGLDGCKLTSLSREALSGLSNLRTLRVRDNSLTVVPSADHWAMVSRLEELFLGGNAWEEIPAGALSGLGSLRTLEVNGCPHLRIVRAHAFSAAVELYVLTLSNNPRLSVLETGALNGLLHLKQLRVRENALRALPEDLVAWDELDVVDVSGNPLECNCSLLWLRDLLLAKGNVSVGTLLPECWTPSELRRKKLGDVNAHDLGCFFPSPRQQAVFAIASVAVVACLAILVFVVYKYRRRVTRALKDQWTEGGLRSKDVHYEKTNDDDAETPTAPYPYPVSQLSPKDLMTSLDL